STSDPASGHFVVNGVAQGTDQNITVLTAQLAGTTFQSGSGSDNLWVRAFDGATWSAWKEFYVNAPGNQASALAYAATNSQNIAPSSLFTASAADGDAFRFRDFLSDPLSGHVVGGLDHVHQNVPVTADAAAGTAPESGSESSGFWAGALDGVHW